jgi:hypothetical protein
VVVAAVTVLAAAVVVAAVTVLAVAVVVAGFGAVSVFAAVVLLALAGIAFLVGHGRRRFPLSLPVVAGSAVVAFFWSTFFWLAFDYLVHPDGYRIL